MSPILVRPVREQLEHDRLIRFLLDKYSKKKFEVVAHTGDTQTTPVRIGANTFFPDLVISSGKKVEGVVEVETGESVNNLEAMAQWVHFARARAAFHLYVPVMAFDAARRLCASHNAKVSEIWTYRPAMDGFDLVRMVHDNSAPQLTDRPAAKAGAPEKAKKPAAKPASRPAAKPATKLPARKPAASRKPARSASKPAAKKAAKPKRSR